MMVHLDIEVDDLDAAGAHAVAAGPVGTPFPRFKIEAKQRSRQRGIAPLHTPYNGSQ